MEHYPLSDRHNALLGLIQGRELRLYTVICICHCGLLQLATDVVICCECKVFVAKLAEELPAEAYEQNSSVVLQNLVDVGLHNVGFV